MGKKFSFETLKEILSPLRDAYVRSGATVGELEYGIIYVAYQMAALDGIVTDDEIRFVTEFTKSCAGASEEGEKKGRDFALRQAGYLELIARFDDCYSEDVRLKAFLAAVDAGLSDKFINFSHESLSYAFAFWTAMAITDGCFSSIERRALEALKVKFDQERAVHKQAEIDNIKRVAAYSIDYDKTIEQLAGKREESFADEDFGARAEELLRACNKGGDLE